MSVQDEAAKVIDTEHVKTMRNMRLPNPNKLARKLAEEKLLRDDTELNRLRRELEERSRVWVKAAEKMRARGIHEAAHWAEMADDQITHILNQETP